MGRRRSAEHLAQALSVATGWRRRGRNGLVAMLLLAGWTAWAQVGAAGPATGGATNGQDGGPPVGSMSQNANGVYTLQQFSRLVVLDAVVTDRKGNLVTGLRREDFRVSENGEAQEILHFEAPAQRSTTEALPIHSTADLDRLAPEAPVNVVVLDEFNTRFEDMAFARYSLKKFLDRQPATLSSPTMLVAVTLQRFTVLQDYTQDKTKLLQALDHHLAAYPWQLQQFSWVSARFTAAFAAISRVAQATVGHPGHKNMIWLGRGFPALDFSGVAVDVADQVDNAIQSCVNQLRDARVTLYAIDPAGVALHPDEYGVGLSGAMAQDPFGGNYTFTKLAKATGGRAFYGRNDVDVEIGTGIRDGSNFYSLSYRPTNTSGNARNFRRIRIALPEHPDYLVTTREGYYRERPPVKVNPENPSKLLAFDLHNAATTNLKYDGVSLTATPEPNDPEVFRIQVSPLSLIWTEAKEGQPREAELVVMSMQFDKKGKVLTGEAKRVTAQATGEDVPEHGTLQRAVTVLYHLKRDPKTVRVRFVVRVSATGRIGSAELR